MEHIWSITNMGRRPTGAKYRKVSIHDSIVKKLTPEFMEEHGFRSYADFFSQAARIHFKLLESEKVLLNICDLEKEGST